MIPVPRSLARIPILRGLYRVALNFYAQLTRGRYLVERRMGLRLLLDRENTVDRQVFIAGDWEPDSVGALFELIEQHYRPGEKAVFVDIGAHWGLYALLAHKAGIYERIVAFEPDPTNYAQLQANLFLNGLENTIEALNLATSDSERTFGLSLKTHRNRGGTQVVEVGTPGEATCRSTRTARQVDIEGKFLVIKMDVEGHELEAVDGLLGLLGKNRCVIQIEVWSTPEGEMQRRLALIEEKLAPYGIKLVRSVIPDHFFVSQPGPQSRRI